MASHPSSLLLARISSLHHLRPRTSGDKSAIALRAFTNMSWIQSISASSSSTVLLSLRIGLGDASSLHTQPALRRLRHSDIY